MGVMSNLLRNPYFSIKNKELDPLNYLSCGHCTGFGAQIKIHTIRLQNSRLADIIANSYNFHGVCAAMNIHKVTFGNNNQISSFDHVTTQ